MARGESRKWRSRLLLVVVLASLTAWSGWFIYRSSYVIAGERYFSLFDDAMISMTYARNCLRGEGLDWARQGEPVEGFTSPLWTFAMLPLQALPLPLRQRALGVQILGLLLLAAAVWLVRRLLTARQPEAGAAGWLPAAVLTAFYYPLDYWTLMGMEVGLQAVLLLAAVHLAFEIDAGRRRQGALWAVFALAYLLRMDMLLAVAAVAGWLAWHGHLGWRQRRRWLPGALLVAAVAAAYQVFRLAYFAAPLPNTYYLKLTGIPLAARWQRGLLFLAGEVRFHLLGLTVLLLVVGALAWRDHRVRLLLLVVALQAAYGVYAGGDAWELEAGVRAGRFVAPAVPLLFVAFNLALTRRLVALAPRGRPRAALAAAATLLLFVTMNGLWAAPAAAANRRALAVADWPWLVPSHALVTAQVRELETVVAPGARVVTFWAGLPAYLTDYRMIDGLGYNDRHIARLPLPGATAASYRPGHSKRDLAYLLAQRPDAFFQLWGVPPDERESFMSRRGYELRGGFPNAGGFWVRSDSPFLLPADRPLPAP